MMRTDFLRIGDRGKAIQLTGRFKYAKYGPSSSAHAPKKTPELANATNVAADRAQDVTTTPILDG
jgi:hypothetical protein